MPGSVLSKGKASSKSFLHRLSSAISLWMSTSSECWSFLIEWTRLQKIEGSWDSWKPGLLTRLSSSRTEFSSVSSLSWLCSCVNKRSVLVEVSQGCRTAWVWPTKARLCLIEVVGPLSLLRNSIKLMPLTRIEWNHLCVKGWKTCCSLHSALVNRPSAMLKSHSWELLCKDKVYIGLDAMDSPQYR